jgi:hypothetical protein
VSRRYTSGQLASCISNSSTITDEYNQPVAMCTATPQRRFNASRSSESAHQSFASSAMAVFKASRGVVEHMIRRCAQIFPRFVLSGRSINTACAGRIATFIPGSASYSARPLQTRSSIGASYSARLSSHNRHGGRAVICLGGQRWRLNLNGESDASARDGFALRRRLAIECLQ